MTANPRAVFGVVVSATWVVAMLAAVQTAGPADQSGRDAGTGAPGAQALLQQYCVTCHNERIRSGGLALDQLDLERAGEHPEVWEKAVRKLRTGMMPPINARRPDRATLDRLAADIERVLDRAAAARPNPGAPALHRLNRTEYANAIRDLLELPVNAATLLPGDDSSEGFDNIADVLSVSPSLMQAYVSAAATISRLAVGDTSISPSLTTYSVPPGLSQADHRDGMPLGTRGGLVFRHTFPVDAEYELRGIGRGGSEPVEVTLNGARVLLVGRDSPVPPGNPRLRFPAGPQTIGVATIQRMDAQGVDDLFSEWARSAGVQSISIWGPLNVSGPGDTPSRRRLFVCRPPPTAPKDSGAEIDCARQILATLATRAFRRPIASDDPSVDMLLDFYKSGRDRRGFETGIQYGLARVLFDPRFIFRFEPERADLPSGAVYRVGDVELASRLSFFLWSSIPDDELLTTAASGRLSEPAVLEAQTRRMLADPRATALVDNFAAQWLLLRELDTVSPQTKIFDGNLRQSFKRETELLFETILREDRSILNLIDADYTFVDGRLAKHYGIPHIRGSRFQRVALAGDARRGLLGHGSILTVTSIGNRTSPVKRGKWVLENLLGASVPPPPPGVETNLAETSATASAPTSLRQRMEQHRTNAACASCHSLMDPIGFALENYDLIGQWRDVDGGAPVNARGVLADGTALNGPASLRQAVLDRRDAFVSTVTAKLLSYALGRTVTHGDMAAVRSIARSAARDDYRFSSLVLGIVSNATFQQRIKARVSEDAPP